MRFRPCIDIHGGRVKQIVGASLSDLTGGSEAIDNFVSELGAEHYAELYKAHGLTGGHVILLDRKDSPAYSADLAQAKAALSAYEGGLQIGGGINDENARDFLDMGASHVIVTSFVFRDGAVDFDRLSRLTKAVGKERLVLDLSCKKRGDEYLIVTDRWQRFTDVALSERTMERLSAYCAEFLVHAADAEGRQRGIERGAAEILAASHIPCTYAGGIASEEDIALLGELTGGRCDFTIGSALDIFGGKVPFARAAAYDRE